MPINSVQDPENGKVTYEKVSGALPPGVHLDKNTGAITGRIPDVDATYEFGIRVTDSHGKYADQIFSIDTRGKYWIVFKSERIKIETASMWQKNVLHSLNMFFDDRKGPMSEHAMFTRWDMQ